METRPVYVHMRGFLLSRNIPLERGLFTALTPKLLGKIRALSKTILDRTEIAASAAVRVPAEALEKALGEIKTDAPVGYGRLEEKDPRPPMDVRGAEKLMRNLLRSGGKLSVLLDVAAKRADEVIWDDPLQLVFILQKKKAKTMLHIVLPSLRYDGPAMVQE